MLRSLVRIFLSLFFLLLGRYAFTFHHRAYCSQLHAYEHATRAAFQSDNTGISCVPLPHTRKSHLKAKAIEIDEKEDEAVLFSKHLETRNFCITFFKEDPVENIALFEKAPLPFCKHFSFYSSCKFIFNLVIRI